MPRRAQAEELATPAAAHAEFMGMPVEIEWALDEAGFKLLQARPLHMQAGAQCRRQSGCITRG